MVTDLFVSIIWSVLLFFVTAIPLYLAVHILGGRSSFIRAAIINVIAGLLIGLINGASTLFALLFAVVLVFVYRQAFRLKWWKAIVVWFVQVVVGWLLAFLLYVVLGVTLFSVF